MTVESESPTSLHPHLETKEPQKHMVFAKPIVFLGMTKLLKLKGDDDEDHHNDDDMTLIEATGE